MGFAAVAAGSVAAAGMNYLGSQNAASAEEAGSAAAAQAQLEMYNQTRADMAPYRQAGYSALGTLQQNMPAYTSAFTTNDFQQDPGYQFDLQQGQQAIQRSAAASGGLVSGQGLTALNNYSQNMASNEFQNAYNRYTNNQNNAYNKYASIAGLGQTANTSTGQAAMATGQGLASTATGAANAQAAGYVGGANAISSGISSGINSYQNYQTGQTLSNLLAQNQGAGGYPVQAPAGSSVMLDPEE
jgi:hypothetical protein